MRNIFYTIVSNHETIPFLLNHNNGELTLTESLDYERKKNFNFVAQINTIIDDETLFSFAIVTINIVNVNDNPPIFKTFYDK